jgi:hypothetical protein
MTDRFRLTKPAIQDIEEIADYRDLSTLFTEADE